MCKPRTTLFLLWQAGPPGLVFYKNGLVYLQSWLGMVNGDGYLGSRFHIISSLFRHVSLFQNAILHKMLKLGFWNFKSIFLKMKFLLVSTLLSLVLAIWTSWYLHLKLSHELLHFDHLTIGDKSVRVGISSSHLQLGTWQFGRQTVFPNI